MIDHAVSEIVERSEEKRYRTYITDAIMIMTENTAKASGGSYLKDRWLKVEVEDDRTGDEIALDVIRRAGLQVKGGEIDGT